ncbi:hypothetical protein ACWCOU_18425, partial [Actinomadura luteofluorescens]
MNAGRLLVRATAAPALVLVAWLAVSLPLLMAGVFRPAPAVALFVPVAALVLWLGLRTRPGDDPGGRPGTLNAPGGLDAVQRWPVWSVFAVTAAFLVLQVVMCAEQVVVRRDPASYVQFATWLAKHGSLPIPLSEAAFGGPDTVLNFASPAFYQDGGAVVPQFMAGWPLVLAPAGWVGGAHGMVLMAPVLGACCVLSFAGLVARLVGPRWAPAGALLLALTLPMLYVSRNTFSELPAIVLLLGGLSLMYDVRREPRDGRVAGAKALLAGAALGLIVLVRIDGLRDVLPVVAFAGLLVARRRAAGYWAAGGLLLGAGAGVVEGFTMSRPYLSYLRTSLVPLLAISAAVLVATVLLVAALRWDPAGARLRRAGAAGARD